MVSFPLASRFLPANGIAAGAEGPEILAARERRGHDGVQIVDAVLANNTLEPGENRLFVAAREREDNRPLAIDPELVTLAFSPDVVDRNFAVLLRGARRTSAPSARRNRYGPYYFVAAAYPGGAECVDAWQRVKNERTPIAEVSRTTRSSSATAMRCAGPAS